MLADVLNSYEAQLKGQDLLALELLAKTSLPTTRSSLPGVPTRELYSTHCCHVEGPPRRGFPEGVLLVTLK